MRVVLGGYLMDTVEEKTAGYKCEMSISVDVTQYSSIAGKTFPVCKMFLPTIGGSFVDPCESYLGILSYHKFVGSSNCCLHTDHDIVYYHLPKEFANEFALTMFVSSPAGRRYRLLKLISIKVVWCAIIL